MHHKLSILIAMTAVACVDVDDGTDVDDGDVETSVVEQGLSAGGIVGTTYKLGGPGGNGPTVRNCNDGDVVIGFFGRKAVVIDQLGVICGHVNANGTIGNQYWPGSVGGGGGDSFSFICPTDHFVRKVVIQANGHSLASSTAVVVNRIETTCGTAFTYDPMSINVGPIAMHPYCYLNTGGISCYQVPDALQEFPQLGTAVGGISLYTGTYVDAFQLSYRNVF